MICPFCGANEHMGYFPESDSYRACCNNFYKLIMERSNSYSENEAENKLRDGDLIK